MGGGVAEVLAASGCEVILYDVTREALDEGVQRIQRRLGRQMKKGRIEEAEAEEIQFRIRPTVRLEEVAPARWVIEAVVEKLDVKRELFTRLEEVVDGESVLATNTSSLSVTAIAAAVKHPERVLGLHFFNPAPVMPLVEVVSGRMTHADTMDRAVSFIAALGKEPVRVKDTPGFLVNRIARPFHSEAYRMVGDGVADKEQLDRILRSAGFKMGPFELQDLIGIDINYAASTSVYDGFFQEPRFRPHPDQRQMVESGALGRKAGRGHYRHGG
ncbi:3-hydroxybutyryl-CoA dehydrogenase [Paludifilum halophilum]|uniref:3-hydroxybutyryl-CoA dehydrogenase n=2 Tax=Paludifilum halophilum TaxID=1642702 RepID=A0A235B5P0_9BACL|nr:3-hydroxybutyryl-CoA dehydrogenase [Paludifilum halophilum]